MAYLNNWLRHMLAPLTGEGLSAELARDFWRADEDLFDAANPIKYRWPKLLFVHCASGISQGTLPTMLVLLTAAALDFTSFRWAFIGIGVVTVIALLFGLLFGTTTYVDVRRRARTPESKWEK